MTEGKIIEIERICGECFQETGKIVPMYEIIDENGIEVHNHKFMKIKEKILETLE
mgnify:FL=1